jgi:uncharacterized RDD family membrane protein YckC
MILDPVHRPYGRIMPGPDPIRRIVDVIVPRAVDSIDLNEVLEEVDLDQLLSRVDLDAVLERIDLDALLDRIDVSALIRRIDMDDLVSRVDVNGLVGRIDLDGLMGRVDVNGLVGKVDMDAVLDRVDVEKLMTRIDIEELIKRAQVEALVRATAGGMGNRLLDLVRRQLVGLDIVLSRMVDRVFHRKVAEPVSEDGTFTGQIAGGATRLAAFFMDFAIESAIYTTSVAAVLFLISLFTGHHVKLSTASGLWQILIFAALAGVYQWLGMVIAGRTIGRAIAGLRVSSPDRSPLSVAAATKRVLVYPFSFVLGLGLIPIVTGRRHRALHDVAAPSLVFYDWGDRPTQMPAPITQFLVRQGVRVRAHDVVDTPAAGNGRLAAGPVPAHGHQQLGHPAEQGDEDPAEEGRPEVVDGQVGRQGGGDSQDRGVDDDEKQAQGQDDQGKAQQPEDRSNDHVDHRPDDPQPHVPGDPAMDINTGNDGGHQGEDDRQDHEPNNETGQHRLKGRQG